MKNKAFIYTFIVVLILISISLGVVFAVNQNFSEDEKLISKTEEQINFLEDKIIAIMNKMNQINFLNSTLTKEKVNNNQISRENGNSSQTNSENSQNNSSAKSSNTESDNTQSNSNSSSNENIKYEIKNDGILINRAENSIDWEYIKVNTETIYSIWPTIVADLNMLNVKSEDILKFSNVLDQVTLSVKNEDKIATLNNLVSLYGFLPNYRNQISQDSQKINIDYTKNCILNSYVMVEQDNWNEVQTQIANGTSYYSIVMDSINNSNIQNQNRISKVYILINELNNCINLQDKDLYYIKYRNLMEELISI